MNNYIKLTRDECYQGNVFFPVMLTGLNICVEATQKFCVMDELEFTVTCRGAIDQRQLPAQGNL